MQVKVSIPSITVPRVDQATGLPTPAWYRFDETMFKRTGGLNGDRTGTLEVRTIALEDGKADKDITITAGNGLTGGGDLSADRTLAATKNTGWTAATGTGNKGAYAAYAGQTVSNPPTQAEMQALDDAVKALSRRVVALEAALRSNGAIDG